MTARRLNIIRCVAISGALMGLARGEMPADASVIVEGAWIPLAPLAMKVHAAYMTVINRSAADIFIVGADSPDYERIELHRSTLRDGVSSMEAVDAVGVPVNGRVEFAPTGVHFMLLGSKRPQALDNRVPMVLRLSSGEKVEVSAIVRRRNDPTGLAPGRDEHGPH